MGTGHPIFRNDGVFMVQQDGTLSPLLFAVLFCGLHCFISIVERVAEEAAIGMGGLCDNL